MSTSLPRSWTIDERLTALYLDALTDLDPRKASLAQTKE
jgi:hypothetical protein